MPKTKIANTMATLLPEIETMQAAELAADPDNNGRHFQGLATHTTRPKDGNETAPDRLGDKPSDRGRTWSDLGLSNLPANMAGSLIIDEYDGPQGVGYSVRAEVEIGPKLWAKQWGYGPEAAERTFGWTDITPEA